MLETIFNSNHNPLWDTATMWLYLQIICVVGICGYAIQSKYFSTRTKIILSVCSFCILFYFSAFRNIGADTPEYKKIFEAAGDGMYNSFDIEPGYWLLNKLLSFISGQPQFIIIFTTLLTLLFIYKALKYFKDSIAIGIALFAFVSIFYFQAYNLTRIYLTAAFLLYSFKYLYEQKHGKYILCIIIATFFHYSAILMLLPFTLYLIYQKSATLFYWLVIVFFVGILMSQEIILALNLFTRYTQYLSHDHNTAFGIGQFIFHIPFLLLIWYLRHKKIVGTMYNLLVVYTICSLMFGYLSYKFLMLGRISIHFMVLYLIIMPYCLNELKRRKEKYYMLFNLMFIGFIIFRCILYFQEFLFLDQIMPYKNIFQ